MESVVLFANKLELRYFFNDKSMYIDSVIRNKCEKELLTLIRYVAELLDVKMMVYTEPFSKEGGYSELWSIAGRNVRANSIVLNIVMHLASRPVLTPEGAVISDVDYDEKRMQDELNCLRLLLKGKKGAVLIPRDLVPQLNLLPRIQKSKFVFYDTVRSYPKILKIVFRELNENNRNRSGSLEIKREQFAQYIYKSTDSTDDQLHSRKPDVDTRQLSLDLFDE